MQPLSQSRLAVFVAGDVNIFFPALVALNSVHQHNSHLPLDYFILFDERDLTTRMSELLDEHGIQFVSTTELKQFGSLDDLELMPEKVWPREVFYNWLAPHYLASIGYSRAIKIDYDLLCVGSYSAADLMIDTQTFAANTWTQDMSKDGIERETLIGLGFDLVGIDGNHFKVPYFNAGFVTINLDTYVETKIFDLFKRTYASIQSQKGKVNVAEQAAIALLCAREGHKIKHLSKDYNMRVTGLPTLHDNHVPEIRNLHYLTTNKPWRPLSFRYIPNYASDKRAGLYLYRNVWLNAASKVDGFTEFVSESPLTDLEYVGLFSRVLTAIYDRGEAKR